MRTLQLVIFGLVLLGGLASAEPEARRGRGRGRSRSSKNKVASSNLSEDMLSLKSNLTSDDSESRKGKVFSLFNIVQFANQPCRSTSTLTSASGGRRNGTCFTQSECTSKGGSPSGSCAAGFGVCCVFYISNAGGSVNQNCTYIRNPDFPNSLSSTSNVQYTINKCDSSVCHLRLDFESFTLKGTGNTLETTVDPADATGATFIAPEGGACLDTFTVTTNTNQRVPTICGQNTGQHIYVDIGSLPSDTAQLQFTTDGTAATRQWEIKVTQLPCNCNAPPDGCLQYHTGVTGRLTTFNFIPTNDNHLAEQDYSICIRQECGYCCVEYTPCTDTNSFSLDTFPMITGMADTLCSLDYIRIEASGNVCNTNAPLPITNRYCGVFLNTVQGSTANEPICDCTAPFAVDVFTDALNDLGIAVMANTLQSRGICLEYRQTPC